MPVEVDVIEWCGSSWRRYPNAKQINRRRYYQGYLNGVLTYLHREIWKSVHGDIAKGMDVHHKDGDQLNNEIDNLECLTKKEHRQRERELGTTSTPKIVANLNRVRHLASAWHASDEGIKWHAENGRRVMANRPLLKKTCGVCGIEFTTKHSFAAMCSRGCYEKRRNQTRNTHTHPLQCRWCKKGFMGSKASATYCGKSCSMTARQAAKREQHVTA